MTAHLRGIEFSNAVPGQRFFVPISAAYCVKLSVRMAAMVTSMRGGTVPDKFEADDVVGIDR